MTIVKFPDRLKRRLAARKPRRSKNGTPEERAARAAMKGEVVLIDRRSVLTGTAAALSGGAAVNLAAIAVARAGELNPAMVAGFSESAMVADLPDPIFAAIERHRAAALRWLKTLEISAVMRRGDAGHEEAQAAEWKAVDEAAEVAESLIETVPTTLAGIFALAHYVTSYNEGGVNLPVRKGLRSSATDWPENDDCEADAGFRFMANVATALRAINGVRS